MGLLQDADEAILRAKEEAKHKKEMAETAAKAKEEAKKEQERHEKDKQQGMI